MTGADSLPMQDVARPKRAQPVAFPHRAIFVATCLSLLFAGAASAQPTVTISPPVTKGQSGTGAAPSAVTDQATAKRLEEDRSFRMNRIVVEGFRDPDDRPQRSQALEQRFATSLNRGSPELVAGKVYDGCYYDGSYFSCADPLSSALRNIRHALR